ncbi:MAG: hypothetical protein ABI475_04190 [Methylophilaceae bacterium]
MSRVDQLGYRHYDLAWQHISLLLPELARIKLMIGEKINHHLLFLSHIGYGFRMLGQSGKNFEGKLFIRHMESLDKHYS